MNLDALFDDLITSGDSLAGPEKIRRLKVLNAAHLSVIMGAPVLGLFYFYIGAIILFYAAVITGLLMAASLLLLRKTKNVTLMGNYVISVLWVLIFLVSWNTGGVTYEGVLNPSWILKGCLILLAVFLTGHLCGTIWALIAFLEIGLIVYLYQIRFQFPNVIPYEISALYHLATFFVGFLLMALMAFLFESDKEEAITGAQVKAQAFRESKKTIDDLLEGFPLPTFVIDRKHRVVQWNTACQDLTGLSAGDMIGKAVWEGFRVSGEKSMADLILDNPETIEEQFSGAVLSKSKGGFFKLETSLPGLNNGGKAVVTAGPLTDESGAILGVIQMVQKSLPGVTELAMRLKQEEAAAVEAKERLKSLSEEHALLKRNIAAFIQGKDEEEGGTP